MSKTTFPSTPRPTIVSFRYQDVPWWVLRVKQPLRSYCAPSVVEFASRNAENLSGRTNESLFRHHDKDRIPAARLQSAQDNLSCGLYGSGQDLCWPPFEPPSAPEIS